jgi:predicted small lipoprotein YifL
MKKAIFILLTTCLVCACGQKGPLVPPETVAEILVTEVVLSEMTESISSHF